MAKEQIRHLPCYIRALYRHVELHQLGRTYKILDLIQSGCEGLIQSKVFDISPSAYPASDICQSSSLWLNPCIVAAPYRNVPEYNYSGQLPDVEDQSLRRHQLYDQQRQQQLQNSGIHGQGDPNHGVQQLLQRQQSGLIGSPLAHLGYQAQFGGSQQLNFDPSLQQPVMMDVEGMEEMSHPNIGNYQHQQPPLFQHHHHQLPSTSRPRTLSSAQSDDNNNSNVPSVVGQPGMPPPAPRPRGPKLKFTPEDDALLVDLKENKALSWKQIAEFFPGRSSGTLQVRYCTKLKAKETLWTDDSVQKLRTALQDYENEKWRIVAMKVGTGYTPAACREKAEEL